MSPTDWWLLFSTLGWESSCGTFADAAPRSWGHHFSRILAQRVSLPTCFCCQLFPADEGTAAGAAGKERHHFNSFHCLSLLHLPWDLLCSHFPALLLLHNFVLFFTASQLQGPYLGSHKSIRKVDFYGDGFKSSLFNNRGNIIQHHTSTLAMKINGTQIAEPFKAV